MGKEGKFWEGRKVFEFLRFPPTLFVDEILESGNNLGTVVKRNFLRMIPQAVLNRFFDKPTSGGGDAQKAHFRSSVFNAFSAKVRIKRVFL